MRVCGGHDVGASFVDLGVDSKGSCHTQSVSSLLNLFESAATITNVQAPIDAAVDHLSLLVDADEIIVLD